jgi:RNA polymerase sigma-70 factor (ECF subfamily)
VALRQEELTSLCDSVDLDRDRALVEQCQRGNAAAFGHLYARYYERLLRFCLRRLNDRHEAEDATQEAFARAWKALPRFAGERRFYPWLTVIAGNICTDILRRRSRTAPTDDMELTAHHPLGAVNEDTSEDLVLAAVDTQLVHRALDRLSTRHRHVLAMREGSGWTYQQIADHEGVEIGTIETLLWRARQALKREFAAVSESKEALAGFLVTTGALLRRTVVRAVHRGASVHQQGGGTGSLRNAAAGVAFTGAAVAAAFIAPHALSGGPSSPAGAPGSALALPQLTVGTPPAAASGGTQANQGRSGTPGLPASTPESGSDTAVAGHPSAPSGASSSPPATLSGGSSGVVAGGIAGGLHQAAGGLNGTVTNTTDGLGGAVSSATGGLNGALQGVSSNVNSISQALGLGTVLPATTGSGTSSGSGTASSNASTTTTTAPGLLGPLGTP